MTPAEMFSIVAGAGLLLVVIVAVAVVWARGVVAEPPATEDERRAWPGSEPCR